MEKEDQLLESKELRNQLIGKIDVLEKVKSLLLIPQTDMASMEQIAEFYSTIYTEEEKKLNKNLKDIVITTDAVKKIYQRNQEEFDSDGVILKSYKDFITGQNVSLETSKGKAVFTYKSGESLTVPMRGLRTFPRRAILRIGMLLRDSKVAAEVRTQLLNIEEKTSDEVKTQDIDEEQKLAIEIGMSYMSGNIEQFAKSSMALIDFKNRHINKLQLDNKALAGQILKWEDRSKINFAIRKLSRQIHRPEAYIWNDLYKELQYKHHIGVKKRGNKPYIQHIKENEWDKVIQSFSALCESNNISPSDILNDVMTEVEVNAW